MSAKSSAQILERALGRFRGELTVADAATRSGLPLRDAEDGLRRLAADRAGHLSATSKGELIYSFPQGLTKPADGRLIRRAGRALARFGLGVVRFAVRAWVSVVLVGYALAFLALLIALTLRGGDDRDSPLEGVGVVLRVIAEALFWTFHPFSPVFVRTEPGWMHTSPQRHRRIPFYERVNRFVFGPPKAKLDPTEQERTILAEIRRQKGRIAPGDVTRVTGFSRDEAERVLLRLVVDYDGDIEVADSGAILYTFAGLRATLAERIQVPSPIWNRRVDLAPLTGNSAGSNLLFAFINGFNLIASGLVIANGLTLDRLTEIFLRLGIADAPPLAPPDGVPLVLGVIPFAFSLALFALPLVRALRRPGEVKRVANENGWRGMLATVLGGPGEATTRIEYTGAEMAKAWATASGRTPTDDELRDAARDLGGEVDLGADGTIVYRFDAVARELEALVAARARAVDDEASAGEVVFSSADEGSGVRDEKPRSVAAAADEPIGAARPPNKPAETLLLEEQKDTLEFLERLMAESKRSRGGR